MSVQNVTALSALKSGGQSDQQTNNSLVENHHETYVNYALERKKGVYTQH